jgi:hypothetical protein
VTPGERTGAANATAGRLRAAVAAWPTAGGTGAPTLTAAVRVFGVLAGIAYRVDHAETARRDAVVLGAITERAVVDALMGLPADVPVAVGDLTERERRLLPRAPRGAVDRDGDLLVRRAVPPLSVDFALVAARHWKQGLVTAGRFAPFCARAMLLPAPPTDPDAAMQASYWGVGIGVVTTGTLRVLVEPEPYVRTRHSSAQWRFVEDIHRQITGSPAAALRRR